MKEKYVAEIFRSWEASVKLVLFCISAEDNRRSQQMFLVSMSVLLVNVFFVD